ncbi:MAG: toll/interleukin-1 receptor domain-containing protein [Flavobacteriaceae bacterium]
MKVFISYSHQDEELKDELLKQLSGFKRKGIIDIWNDRKIIAGDNWKNEIDQNLEIANIIILLISADFIASDYCNDIELKRALERHEDRNDPALVIPIILRDCHWEQEDFSHLQCLPTGGKPVMNKRHWSTVDEAFTDVAIGLSKVFEKRKNTVLEITDNNSNDFKNILSTPDTDVTIAESYKYNCNRSKQGETFKEHFYENVDDSLLQFSFIYGEKDQQIDSFFTRIYLEVLNENAEDSIKKIDLKEENYSTFKFGNSIDGTIKKFRRILERNIKIESDEELKKEFNSHQITKLKSIKSYKFLVFQLKVNSQDCINTKHGAAFVNWLLNEFFQANIKFTSDTKIIFFFSLTFNHKKSLFSSIKSKKNKLIRQISESVRRCEIFDNNDEVARIFCDMDELESVNTIELLEWFNKLYRNQQTAKNVMHDLFGSEDKDRSMSEIELQLHPVVDYFLNKENEIKR